MPQPIGITWNTDSRSTKKCSCQLSTKHRSSSVVFFELLSSRIDSYILASSGVVSHRFTVDLWNTKLHGIIYSSKLNSTPKIYTSSVAVLIKFYSVNESNALSYLPVDPYRTVRGCFKIFSLFCFI